MEDQSLPAHSHINHDNFMNTDTSPGLSDGASQFKEDLLHCDQLQKDTEDGDSVPVSRIYHPLLDGKSFKLFAMCLLIYNGHIGMPWDATGNDLPKGTPPPVSDGEDMHRPPGDWTLYNDCTEFETADLLFTFEQMSANNLDKLFNIWEATLTPFDAAPPFTNSADMYKTINSTPYGDLCWESFSVHYNLAKDPPVNGAPAMWKTAEYDGWFWDPHKLIQNILANRGFDKEFDYAPYQEYDYKGQHCFHDLFSGNWCWQQAVSLLINDLLYWLTFIILQDTIAQDPNTHGTMIIPIILGSNKTTVLVGTGNNEYWLVYMSIGNIHNKVC